MNSPFRERLTLRNKSKSIRLGRRTLVMGVLNVTPDSFSDGGRFLDSRKAVRKGLEMVREGADWIDVGGESTRPGSVPVNTEEELRRVLPVIGGLRRKTDAWISIDTTKSEVAEQALRAGANLINDISGLRFDPELAQVARKFRCPLVLMHIRGAPKTMQSWPFARDVWRSVLIGLKRSVRRALEAGLRRNQLILDPGFGFGKSPPQNFELLAGWYRLRNFHLPLLVGSSRKSFIQRTVARTTPTPGLPSSRWPLSVGEIAPELIMATAGTLVAAILGGAHIVRVHDVRETLPALRIADAILRSSQSPRD